MIHREVFRKQGLVLLRRFASSKGRVNTSAEAAAAAIPESVPEDHVQADQGEDGEKKGGFPGHAQVTIVGTVGFAPQQKQTSSGSTYAVLSVATTSRGSTVWHRVVLMDESTATRAVQMASVGSRVFLEGELAYKKIQLPDGRSVKSADILVHRQQRFLVVSPGRGHSEVDQVPE